jgi:hypothetical protein
MVSHVKTWCPALTSVTQPFGAGTPPPLEVEVEEELELVDVEPELEAPLLVDVELDEAPPAPPELVEVELEVPLLVEVLAVVALCPAVSLLLPQAAATRRGSSKEAYVFMLAE